ncbi:hypothetical protein [Romboutsia sp.]|uniref:hypothetical protein n=1 Tax=Romboutsia sp. TaxID=1965302 RepID=UPI002D7FFE43|nr:hypothetical protein [Romboutsia sp.]
MLRLAFANLKYFGNLPPRFPDAELYKGAIGDIVGSGMNFGAYSNRIDVMMYVWFYSIIQFISGNIYITIINMNTLFGSLAIYNAGKIAKEIKDEKAMIITMSLLLAYPSLILYTTDNLREGLVLFFITLAIYNLVKYIKYRESKNILIYCVLLIPIFSFRVVNLPMMVVCGVVGVVIANRKTINIKYLIAGSILTCLIAWIIVYNFTNVRITLDYINQTLNRDRFDSMAYLVGLRYDNWLELIAYIPIRLFYLMFYPFPWALESYQYLIVTISSLYEVIIVLIVIIFLFKESKYIKNKTLLYSIISFALICLTAYAVVKSEAATRHRLQFMWMFPTVAGILISNQISIIYDKKFKRLYKK